MSLVDTLHNEPISTGGKVSTSCISSVKKTLRCCRILYSAASPFFMPLACLMINESPASDQQTTSSGNSSTILNVRSKNTGMWFKGSNCAETPAAAPTLGSLPHGDCGTAPAPEACEMRNLPCSWRSVLTLPISLAMVLHSAGEYVVVVAKLLGRCGKLMGPAVVVGVNRTACV